MECISGSDLLKAWPRIQTTENLKSLHIYTTSKIYQSDVYSCRPYNCKSVLAEYDDTSNGVNV